MFFKKLLLIAFAKGNGGYPIAAIFMYQRCKNGRLIYNILDGNDVIDG